MRTKAEVFHGSFCGHHLELPYLDEDFLLLISDDFSSKMQ